MGDNQVPYIMSDPVEATHDTGAPPSKKQRIKADKPVKVFVSSCTGLSRGASACMWGQRVNLSPLAPVAVLPCEMCAWLGLLQLVSLAVVRV